MIGTRLDEVDAPRLIKSSHGWWFIGNGTWTLLGADQVRPGGEVSDSALHFLRSHGAFRPRRPASFSLTVLTSTACNLGCGYCFQNTGHDEQGGNRPPRIATRRLSSATIAKIVEFTAGRMKRAGLDKLFLMLFGGEPLLNPKGCVDLLDAVRPLGLRNAAMTTNGVLLTPELARELYSHGLRNVQITFDGSREDHDRTRVRHNGGETFDEIVDNIAGSSAETGLFWGFRVNVSHHNVERIDELFDQLKDRVKPSRCAFSFAWVGDSRIGYENNLGHTGDVADRFVGWHIAALERGFRIQRPSMRTTCQICSEPGGRHGAVVNADGTLYSSWQSAGKDGWAVGNVSSGYHDVNAVADRWVTCGYEYVQEDAAIFDEFRDVVDGRVLDYMYTTDLL